MNFKEMRKQTEEVLSEIRHRQMKSEFWKFHQQLSTLHSNYFSEATKENLSPIQFQSVHKSFIKRVNSVVQNTDLGQVFVNLHEYRDSVSKTMWQAPLVKSGGEGLTKEMDGLWKQLNDLMRKPENFPLILEIIGRFNKLKEWLQYFENCQQFLITADNMLDDKREPTKNQAGLELEFSLEIQTLAELNFRMNSLQVVYTEACLIFGVSETSYPLTLSKVESGSLWTRIFGESKVIEFVIWFFKNSIRFLHRNYTAEGKLERIPVKIKMLDEQLGLLKKLKEMLPEKRYKAIIEGQAETLAKASYFIARHTQNLLERETRLKIDDEVIQLEYPHKDKYLETVKKQLPEHSDFIVVDPESIEHSPTVPPEGNTQSKEKPKKS